MRLPGQWDSDGEHGIVPIMTNVLLMMRFSVAHEFQMGHFAFVNPVRFMSVLEHFISNMMVYEEMVEWLVRHGLHKYPT